MMCSDAASLPQLFAYTATKMGSISQMEKRTLVCI